MSADLLHLIKSLIDDRVKDARAFQQRVDKLISLQNENDALKKKITTLEQRNAELSKRPAYVDCDMTEEINKAGAIQVVSDGQQWKPYVCPACQARTYSECNNNNECEVNKR